MFPYILCTCGRDIGSLKEIIRAVCDEIISEEKSKSANPEMMSSFIPFADTIHPNLGPVYDACHLNLDCCRKSVMTCVEFHKIY